MQNRPPEFNVDAIGAQLAQDRVAATDPALDGALQGVVAQARDMGVGDLRIIVLDWQPDDDHVTRDLAQQILDRDGGTVVVRAPAELVAVSDVHPRAALENAQLAGVEKWDYTMGMSDFVESLAEWSVPYADLNLAALGLLAVVAAAMPAVWWRRARRGAHVPRRATAQVRRAAAGARRGGGRARTPRP